MISKNLLKQILYFTLAKHLQNFGNKKGAQVRIRKSLIEINIQNYDLPKYINALVKCWE